MKIRKSSVFAVMSTGCIVGLLAACAADSKSTTESTNSDLIGGRQALEGEFAGALLIRDDCSATKVGPRKILTAAHCIDTHLSVGSTIDVTQSAATGAFAMKAPAWQAVTITQVDIAPSWVEGCVGAACAGAHVVGEKAIDDVALVTVDQDIVGEEVAVDLSPVKEGDAVIIAGYGCEESVGGAWDYKNQRLRVAETTALSFEASVHPGSYVTKEDIVSGVVKKGDAVRFATPGPDYTLVTDWRSGGTALTADGGGVDEAGVLPVVDSGAPVVEDPTIGGLCPGDSGGPVLRRVDDKLVLVGVNSSYTFARGYEYTLEDGTTFRYGGAPATNLHARVDANDIGKWLKGLGVSTVCSAKNCE